MPLGGDRNMHRRLRGNNRHLHMLGLLINPKNHGRHEGERQCHEPQHQVRTPQAPLVCHPHILVTLHPSNACPVFSLHSSPKEAARNSSKRGGELELFAKGWRRNGWYGQKGVQKIVMEDESASYVHGGLAPVANVQNIAIDTKSPFYLHPSDHPGLIFVTQPLSENGENYFTWRRNMLTALQSKNKVDGLIAKPDVHSRDFQSWIQCNAVVKSWIVNSLSRELQTSAAHADTASEIWCDFDERFTQGIALRVYDLKRSIALLQQEKSAISTYYGKLKGVWNELHNLRPIPVCTCGAGKKMQEMREEEKVFDFLMGLDDTYKTVRSQILSIDPLPGLGRAYAVAAQEEK
ncbi:hypothetical protein RJ639_010915 [Escallonia herrerae]|uniref:Retrotransposon Copia-like N-terminal domain-containing protein n=1 Tax=Escallonia herrerae TaxID=1293975 RepID=A0AA88VME8_9ASTE|nr:hypothetical protein RJ639_010915 [Escallonia herrerae]